MFDAEILLDLRGFSLPLLAILACSVHTLENDVIVSANC